MFSPLIELLKSYDKAYQAGTPVVSDLEYDNFKDATKAKYPDDPYFQTVGTPVTTGRKVKLDHVIGSLNKTNVDTIQTWLDKYDTVVVSEKLDGSGIYVTYDNGHLVSAATRGDGSIGQNITDKAKHFLPKTINYTKKLVLRGEAMLLGDNHIKLGFKNKRNGVAGLLNRQDFRASDVVFIVPFFHEVIEPEMVRGDMFDFLNTIGFQTPRYHVADTNNIVEFLTTTLAIWKADADYEIDGLVLSDTTQYREDTYYPEHSVAFKVNQESIRAKVIDVEWNVGRTGRVIPTVIVEPVEIDGTTVRRATGFNAKFIKDNNIKPGTIIGLVKAGEIIPYITFVENE